jgi:hypothetical protein
MRRSILLIAATLLPGCLAGQDGARSAPPIADNSFLLEEAYNQEPGVIQHISALLHLREARSWAYTFTEEWPLAGQRHQISLTIPLQRVPVGTGYASGVGDVAVNYRCQLRATRTVAAAPRLSIVLPTGAARRELGVGAPGVQTNLPLSITLSGRAVTHWNSGLTLTPRAENASGERATTLAANAGASAVWHLRPTVDLLLELAWTRTERVTGPQATAPTETWLVNPGVRWAHNFSSGLQIVPGIALPIGVGSSNGERGVLVYLSFEHPLRRSMPGAR